jgi:hypothetical protein
MNITQANLKNLESFVRRIKGGENPLYSNSLSQSEQYHARILYKAGLLKRNEGNFGEVHYLLTEISEAYLEEHLHTTKATG